MDRYMKIAKIGGGGSVWVYKGHDRVNNKAVAIKEVYFFEEHEGVSSMVIREISLLKEMEHKNIVRLLDVANKERRVRLVFEYMDLDLKKFMDTCPAMAKDSSLIKWFLYQILSGVTYCHSHKILHRDLKPQNLLIDLSNKVLKIADFGSARAVDGPPMKYTPEERTPWYGAPELLLGSQPEYSTPVDVWSVGCVFAEMVRQKPLFAAPSKVHVLVKIFSIMGIPNEETWPGVAPFCDDQRCFLKTGAREMQNLTELFPHLEPAGINLLSKMLCMNPSRRITAREALKHEYFNDIETTT